MARRDEASQGGSIPPKPQNGVSISFGTSVLSMLPLTKANREVRDQIKSMADIGAAQAEQERIDEIRLLVPELALKQLLRDTNSDLHYFNRLMHMEKGDANALEESSELSSEAKTRQTQGDCQHSTCQWVGLDNNRRHLECINASVIHPWKMYSNVYGDEEPLRLDHCAYHAKYCIDPAYRHCDTLVAIQTPNKLALCNECYVQTKRSKPPTGIRIPGKRRVGGGKQRSIRDERGSCCNRHPSHRQDSPSTKVSNNDATPSKAKLSKPNSIRASVTRVKYALGVKRKLFGNRNATRIQSIWRMHRDMKMALAERENIAQARRVIAATKIQLLTKSLLRKNAFQQLKVKFWHAATNVIRVARGFLSRRSARKLKAATVLTRALRAYRMRIHYSARLLIRDASRRRHACGIIQNWGRACIRRSLERRTVSATTEDENGVTSQDMPDKGKEVKHDPIMPAPTCMANATIQLNNSTTEDNTSDDEATADSTTADEAALISSVTDEGTAADAPTHKEVSPSSNGGGPSPPDNQCTRGESKRDKEDCDESTPIASSKELHPCRSSHDTHEYVTKVSLPKSRGVISRIEMEQIFERERRPDIRLPDNVRPIRIRASKQPNRQRGGLSHPHTAHLTQESVDTYPGCVLSEKSDSEAPHLKSREASLFESKGKAHSLQSEVKASPLQPDVEASSLRLATATTQLDTDDEIVGLWPTDLMLLLKDEAISKEATRQYMTCPFPNCKKTTLDVRKHLLSSHSQLEMQYLMDARIDSKDEISVEGLGPYILVPPFQPPAPICLCMNHVPPHPKCPRCQEAVEKNGPLPPVRFFEELHVKVDSTGGYLGPGELHLKLQTKEEGVMVKMASEVTRFAQIEALCQDGWGRFFVGCHVFYSFPEMMQRMGVNVPNGTERSHSDDELFMDTSIHYVDLKNLKATAYVLCCSRGDFPQRRNRIHNFRPEASVRFSSKVFSVARGVVSVGERSLDYM